MTSPRTDQLLFAIADALDLTLYSTHHGTSVDGSRVKTIHMGPWEGKLHCYAKSDFINEDSVGVLVKIRKNLWAYVLCFETNSGMGRGMHLYMFDGKAAGAKTGDLPGFCTGSWQKTWAKIEPHVKATFHWRDERWEPHVSSLDGQIAS